MPSPSAIAWAVLLALAGCEPADLYGGEDGSDTADTALTRGGVRIINGGTISGAWDEQDTAEAKAAAPAAPAPEPDPAPPAPPAPAAPASGCGSALEHEVLELVNAERARYGKPALLCEPAAADVARRFSGAMCSQRFFSHIAPDGSTPVSRLDAAGIRYVSAGENIAAGQKTAAQVMGAWIGSSGHRANILGAFSHLGVGYAACPTPHYHYWTQSFVRR